MRVPDAQRKDLAFEALFSGQSDAPIFSGLTGYTRGDEGDRSGNVVLVYDRDATSKFVIVPLVNPDNNQHSANENLRIGHLWNAIETDAALLMTP